MRTLFFILLKSSLVIGMKIQNNSEMTFRQKARIYEIFDFEKSIAATGNIPHQDLIKSGHLLLQGQFDGTLEYT